MQLPWAIFLVLNAVARGRGGGRVAHGQHNKSAHKEKQQPQLQLQ